MSGKKNFHPEEEKKFLNTLASGYGDQAPYSKVKKDIILGLIDQVIGDGRKKTGLQMGCANGYETEQLAKRLGSLTVVDGSSDFVANLSKKNGQGHVKFVCTLFEEMHSQKSLKQGFDYIFCNYVLEHVHDVQSVLAEVRNLLKRDGKLFVVVPNRDALSRRLAKEMGLVKDLKALTENDHKHGHRRTFSRASLLSEIRKAGLQAEMCSGVILKILADFQLNKLLKEGFLQEAHFRALQKMSRNPGLAALADSVFVVARR